MKIDMDTAGWIFGVISLIAIVAMLAIPIIPNIRFKIDSFKDNEK